MSRRKQLPFVMTLRLDGQLAADLEEIALSLTASKAAFIRRCLRLAVENVRDQRQPAMQERQGARR
jgi:predicted transcriptional regulator